MRGYYFTDVLPQLSLSYSSQSPTLRDQTLEARNEELSVRTAMDGRHHSETLATLDSKVVLSP